MTRHSFFPRWIFWSKQRNDFLIWTFSCNISCVFQSLLTHIYAGPMHRARWGCKVNVQNHFKIIKGNHTQRNPSFILSRLLTSPVGLPSSAFWKNGRPGVAFSDSRRWRVEHYVYFQGAWPWYQTGPIIMEVILSFSIGHLFIHPWLSS